MWDVASSKVVLEQLDEVFESQTFQNRTWVFQYFVLVPLNEQSSESVEKTYTMHKGVEIKT